MSLRSRVREFLDDAQEQMTLHMWLMIFWAVQLPIVCLIYFFLPDVWKAVSILYLAIVSIYANFVGHFGSWQASKVEVRQEEIEADRQDEVMNQTEKIVEEVDKRTPDR
jgi:hypothetical protein